MNFTDPFGLSASEKKTDIVAAGVLVGTAVNPLVVLGVGVTLVIINPEFRNDLWNALGEAGANTMAASDAIKTTAVNVINTIVDAVDIGTLKKNPPEHPDYTPPKNWDGNKVKNPNGAGSGWPTKSGEVWVPENHKGTHAPHWDVQNKDGSHNPVYPE